MKTLNIYAKPEPTIAFQQEGCGESVKYNDKIYCYCRAGKYIPKNKPALLKWEGGFAGRMHGDKEWLIVCYNEQGELLLLEWVYNNPREHMKSYTGMSNAEAIAIAKKKEQKLQEIRDSFTPCANCGKPVIVLESNQKQDECLTCFNEKKKP